MQMLRVAKSALSVNSTTFCRFMNVCYDPPTIERGWPPYAAPTPCGVDCSPPRMRNASGSSSHTNKTIKVAQITDVHIEPNYAQVMRSTFSTHFQMCAKKQQSNISNCIDSILRRSVLFTITNNLV